MGTVMLVLEIAIALGLGVCFVLVLAKMFQNGQTGIGLACILLVFLFGIGSLIVFVYAWVQADRWGIKTLMFTWTGLLLIAIALSVLSFMGLLPSV